MNDIAIMGCGWLGLPLAEFLIEKGFRIAGSTTHSEKLSILKEKGIDAYLIKAEEKLKGENVDQFFIADTLILNIPPGGRRNPEAAQKYPQYIRMVAEAARQGDIRCILFISSTGVYGDEAKVTTEMDPPDPKTASGKALIKAEEWLRQQDFPLTILRLAGLVGGERKAGRFLAGKTNVPKGQAPVNLIHREDCIRIIYEILRQKKWGETFNACADEHPGRAEFYTHRAEKEGFVPPVFVEEDLRGGKIISNTKVKEVLGYQFLYSDPMEF